MLAGVYLLAPPVVEEDHTVPYYLEVVGVGGVAECNLWRGCRAVPVLALTSTCHVVRLTLTSAYTAREILGGSPSFIHTLKPPLGERRLGEVFSKLWTNARYLAFYLRPLSRKYGASAQSIFEGLSIPGRGSLFGERFVVYRRVGEYLLMEAPWGVDFVLNFVLGVVDGGWVLMGRDGLYVGVFHRREDGERFGYVEVVGPYQDDVRKIEGPPYLGFAAASTPGFPICGGGGSVSYKGVCLDDGEVFRGVTMWPVERVDVSAAASRLRDLCAEARRKRG
ncbi:hypothetical protein [Pyrobaculum ferrireducens]|uniref:Uncharacterized protein n=1 Tax=Pyrobaculum ferrireducens TaxID=1104324 RepID=G7VEJ0_9CREN|nr:hypothetical protein [Pyrobaculum ferrireducens]AET31614.1 hypothetical protein P186_0153 [Pyrobaculum ferrireducens]